jgi:PhnB protein
MFIPEGFNTITPYFFVRDAARFVDFLSAAFGGVEIHRSLRPDGAIANAQIRIGGSTVMVSEASARYPAMPGSYYLYVANADAAMAQALAAGARLEMAVADMPYDDRQGGVVDPFGNIWWLSQRLVDAPYSA